MFGAQVTEIVTGQKPLVAVGVNRELGERYRILGLCCTFDLTSQRSNHFDAVTEARRRYSPICLFTSTCVQLHGERVEGQANEPSPVSLRLEKKL